MNSTRLTRTLAGLILSASGLALAGTATAPAHAVPAAPATHCVTSVDTHRTSCYATFTLAIRAATGGRVTDAPANPSDAADSAAFAAELNAAGGQAAQANVLRAAVGTPAASDTVISIEYLDRDKDETGGDQVWTANKGCPDSNGNDVDHSYGDVGWTDNKITSFQGYANCAVIHYDGYNSTGAHIGPSFGMNYLGDAMDNRTSSLEWT